MKIYNLNTVSKNGEVEISVLIDSARLGQQRLWFSTPERFGDYLCKTRMDGFLVGFLFPAMQYGEDIHVEGCVSQKMLFNINNYVIPLLMAFSPSSKRISVTADEVSAERFDVQGVGTGFSAGVDSFCTIYDRMELEESPDYRVNSFLFLNVGSHGGGESAEKLALAHNMFRKRYEYLRRFPDELGLDFFPLNSNLHTFHPWGHQKTHTLTSAAGVLLLQSHFFRYYYASSGVDYKDMMCNADHYKDIDVGEYCDPVLLPLLSTESLEFVLDGAQYTRVEKVLRIVDYAPVKKYLNVCVSGEGSHENCSVCPKCCRTLMSLKSAGQLSEFFHLFDVKKYERQAERKYVCKQVLLANKDPFAKGNVELAKLKGIKLPPRMVCLFVVWYWRVLSRCAKIFLPESVRTIIKKWRKGRAC